VMIRETRKGVAYPRLENNIPMCHRYISQGRCIRSFISKEGHATELSPGEVIRWMEFKTKVEANKAKV